MDGIHQTFLMHTSVKGVIVHAGNVYGIVISTSVSLNPKLGLPILHPAHHLQTDHEMTPHEVYAPLVPTNTCINNYAKLFSYVVKSVQKPEYVNMIK